MDETTLRLFLMRLEEGTLSDEEIGELAQALKQSREARRTAVFHGMVTQAIGEGLALDAAAPPHGKPTLKARPASRFRAVPLALAASLLLALGIGLWMSRTGSESVVAQGVIARVESVQGSVFSVQDAAPERLALKAGDDILPGMRIETGAESAVTLAWATEATTVELAGNSKLETRNSKLARLRQGQLTATIAPQLPDQPFAVETPHALATVLGTRFRLEVRGGAEGGESEKWKVESEGSPLETGNSKLETPLETGNSKLETPLETGNSKLETGGSISGNQSTIENQKSKIPPPSTWLSVEEGTVRFLRLTDQASVDVAAGEFAVAGKEYDLKPHPLGTDRIEGAILLEDDFESGTLDNWHSIVGDWQVVPRPDGKGHCLKLAWKANDPITPRILARLDALPPDLEISYEFRALPTQYGFGPWFRDAVTGENVQARDLDPQASQRKKFAPVYADEWVLHVASVRHGRVRLQAYQDGKPIYDKEGELAGLFTAVGLAGFNVRQDSDLYVDNVVIRRWQEAPAPDKRADRNADTDDNGG